MAIDIKKRKPILGNIMGGLSGPAVKPVALRMIYQVTQAVSIPVLGMGGISSTQDAIEFLMVGASAISLGTGIFTNPILPIEIKKGLEKYCLDNNISIVIPTIDTELDILAMAKNNFSKHNIFIAISSKEICNIFYLKDSTEKFFLENNFDTPRHIENIQDCDYPIFAKLNNSSSSIGALVAYTPEVSKELSHNKNYIFQEYIQGCEYTVDVFINKHNEVISIVPRQRLETRAGEVSKAKTVKDNNIIKAVKKLCRSLKGAYGCITIQLFKTD
jgi:hypothetical protein